MDIADLLRNKEMKSIEKRAEIVEGIKTKLIGIQDILQLKDVLDDKKMAVVFEAMEAVTAKEAGLADKGWLLFAQDYITSESNSLKREASRLVGNIAHLFPDDLDAAISRLLENTKNDGAVVRWASAYALGRIVPIQKYANGDLFDVVSELYEQEEDNGIKNQYLSGLKKARKLRG